VRPGLILPATCAKFDTKSPRVTGKLTIVPEIGERTIVFSRFACALLSAPSACLTFACARATSLVLPLFAEFDAVCALETAASYIALLRS